MAFDVNEQGNVELTPLVRYDAAVIADTSCALRLILARQSDPLGTGSLVVQMGMSVEQAKALVADLQQMIDHVVAVRAATRPN
jgi:hypothetical protein